MEKSDRIKWLFLDLNSYFASVEQQENPALRDKPVAVVPMLTDSTCAIAASYEAKKYGIKTGTKIYEARRLCPNLRCVLARHDKYVDYHHRILSEVIKHVPINKVWSVDELSSRLPPRQRNLEAASFVAHQIKKGLSDNVGSYIKCSIGLASNSFLAKVATDMQKPDGLTILEPDKLPGALFDLKLTDLPGINVKMQAKLAYSGIYTVEQFWNLSPKHARKAWGSVLGERFWYSLRGFELPELETKNVMIGHSRVLDPELREPEKARLVARRLTIKAAGRLRRKKYYATCFSMSIRTADKRRYSAEVKLPPAQDSFTFLKAIDDIWYEVLLKDCPKRIKKVSINMAGLCKREDITPNLFDIQSKAHQKLQKKHNSLSKIIDGLNKKYGAESLQIGISPKTSAGYVGTKIAFSRIPDQEEFWE